MAKRKIILSIIVFFLFLPLAINSQTAELIIPSGQNSWIMAIKISPDGKYLVSAAMDNSVKIYDLKEKREVFTFWEHTEFVSAIDISSDNRTVVSGDATGENIVWDLYSGKVLFKCKGEYPSRVSAIAISPDNKTFLSGNRWGVIAEFDLKTGLLNIEETYHEFAINKICFIKEGSEFYTSAKDDSVLDSNINFAVTKTSDKNILHSTYLSSAIFRSSVVSEDGSKEYYVVKDPNELRVITNGNLDDSEKISISDYSPFDIEIISEDQLLIACQRDEKIIFLLFNTQTNSINKVIHTDVMFLENHGVANFRMYFVPGTRTKVVYTTGYGIKINLTDLETGISESYIPSKTAYQIPLLIQNKLYLGGEDKRIKSWDLTDNSLKTIWSSNKNTLAIIPYKEGIITKENKRIILWEKDFKQIKDSIVNLGNDYRIYLNPDSTKLVIDNYYEAPFIIYDLIERKQIKNFEVFTEGKNNLAWSDNNTVVFYDTYENRNNLVFFNLESKEKVAPVLSHQGDYQSSILAFNTDLNLTNIVHKGIIYLVDNSGKSIKEKQFNDGNICQMFQYNSKLKQLIVSFSDGKVLFLNSQSLEVEKELEGHKSWVLDITFSEDYKKAVTTSYDNTIRIWDFETGKTISTLSLLNSKDWVVVNEDGLFDASPQAMKEIYYVVNDELDIDEPWKIIELEQLKHRYYQPNLLQIKLGYNAERLRTPLALETVPLAPKVKCEIVGNELKINLKNQKGGIGKVSVFIDNAEVISDARDAKFNADSNSTSISIDLNKFNRRFTEGNPAEIKVIATNKEGWINSRPEILSYNLTNSKGMVATSIAVKDQRETIRLFGLVAGTSDYMGNLIDLRYASKDAADFTNALQLTAENLFGEENTTIELLSTDFNEPEKRPSRANILNSLSKYGEIMKPSDILIVYLSGHGVNFGGADGDFYYLTQESSNADAASLNDAAIRNSVAISSDELTEMINTITAGKKILILDACSSGKAAEKMFDAKDVPASQIRALDRMQDRTGFYVLASSAADAVSYESSIFGQGLLTYSLLKAMKGAALRKDAGEEYVDIVQLFQFAVEEVPNLSKEIGGIQKPFFKSPDNQQSYDIGKVDLEVKNKIIISDPKPMLLEVSFSDNSLMYDVLSLSESFNAYLENNASKGKQSDIGFTRAKEYPNSYKISGTYAQDNDEIKISYIIIQNKIPIKPISTITILNQLPIEDAFAKIIDDLKTVNK